MIQLKKRKVQGEIQLKPRKVQGDIILKPRKVQGEIQLSYTLPAVPDAPVTLAATDVLDVSFTANWVASTRSASYRLDVSTQSDFSTYVSGYENLTVSSTSQSVTGLTADTTYYYRVRGFNIAGSSANSDTRTQATAAGSGYQFNNCIDLEGDNDYIELNSNMVLTDQFTFSGWIYSRHLTADDWIVGFSTTNTIMKADDTTIRCRLNAGPTRSFTVGSMGLSQWNHLMVTSDGTSCRVYLNGLESTSGVQTVNSGNRTFKAFGRLNGGGNYFDGRFDDFAFFDGIVATEANASDIYNSGDGADPETVLGVSADHRYLFDETSGTTASDSAGTNDGDLNNFTGTFWVDHNA